MNGRFEIYLDGDLFKTTIIFPVKRELQVKYGEMISIVQVVY